MSSGCLDHSPRPWQRWCKNASPQALNATSLEKREGKSPLNLDCGVGILHWRPAITMAIAVVLLIGIIAASSEVPRRDARASERNPLTRLNSDPCPPRPTTTKTKRCDESQDIRLSDIELRLETDQFLVPYLAQTRVWTPSGVLPETSGAGRIRHLTSRHRQLAPTTHGDETEGSFHGHEATVTTPRTRCWSGSGRGNCSSPRQKAGARRVRPRAGR